MEAIVKKEFQRQHRNGTMHLYRPGDRIKIGSLSETVHRIFEIGYMALAMTEGRSKSLDKCMEATMFLLMEEIQQLGHFKTTPEVLEIEEEVHRVRLDVLGGRKVLADYREVAERWKTAGTQA